MENKTLKAILIINTLGVIIAITIISLLITTNKGILNSNINDRSYKLFFGEWIIEELIDVNPRSNSEKDILGDIVYYDNETFVCKDTKTVNPHYEITILPTTDIQFYKYMMSPREIGITGDYFVHVFIYPVDFDVEYIGEEFYIVDDNTLILIEGGRYYKARRVSYIDDYLYNYEHI